MFSLIFILEIIGTVAFAISGASIAIKKGMDIFGIAVLGTTTAVGGGIIRDLILGINPPLAFKNPIYAIVAIIVSLLVFSTKSYIEISEDNIVVLLMDDIGLGIFTVVGVKAGMPYNSLFLSVFVGVLTGVGGGVLRDLFAGNIPLIFSKHFYACASIIGAIASCLIWRFNPDISMIFGAIIVIILRIFAVKYNWNLPR